MDADLAEAQKVQTFIFVWDIQLKIASKVDKIDMFSPKFSLNPNNIDNTNSIRLRRCANRFDIESMFSSKTELKRCTIYMINPLKCTLLERYNGFGTFPWNHHEWSDKMRFVFEMELHCDASAVQPIVWKHLITEMKPAINTNPLLLNLDAEKATHTVKSNRGTSCVIKRYTGDSAWFFEIQPEFPSENWNLLTVMLNNQENNIMEWCYSHSTSTRGKYYKTGGFFSFFMPVVVFEIHELSTSVENILDLEMTAIISDIIKPIKTLSTGKKELQQLNIASNLTEYFSAKKFCDVTVQVGDQQIRAHKVMLATKSTTLRVRCYEDETLDTIFVDVFAFETIQQMIEYMYTGAVKLGMISTEQLLRAAHKYGVAGLKELCEEQLIETIDMENVVNLLVLAEGCDSVVLFNKILVFVRENYADFMKLEDTRTLLVMHPDVALKLFTKIN